MKKDSIKQIEYFKDIKISHVLNFKGGVFFLTYALSFNHMSTLAVGQLQPSASQTFIYHSE